MENQFKEQLLQSQLETQENSFIQISQELHDNIGQLLSTTKLLLGMATMELTTVPDTLRTAEQTVGKAIQDLRILSKTIDKEWLHQFNLMDHLESEKQRINTGKQVEVSLNSQYQKLPLEPGSQVILFRVIQKCLQNSIKYALSKHIAIDIANTHQNVNIFIEDDGVGLDASPSLKNDPDFINMKNRVGLLGGIIKWSKKENGTIVTINIPVKE